METGEQGAVWRAPSRKVLCVLPGSWSKETWAGSWVDETRPMYSYGWNTGSQSASYTTLAFFSRG